MRPRFGITCSWKLKLTKVKLYKGMLWGSSTVTLMTCLTLALSALYCAAIPSLADRREQLSRKFFKINLLPNPRDPTITTRLRSANKFPRLPSRMRKYHTFISYALSQYQSALVSKYPSYYPYIFYFTAPLFYIFLFTHCVLLLLHVYYLPMFYCAIWSYDHKTE